MALFRMRSPATAEVVGDQVGEFAGAVMMLPVVEVAENNPPAGVDSSQPKATWWEVFIGLASFAICLGLALTVPVFKESDVEFSARDGISALALFYVMALAIERLLEFIGAPIEWLLALTRKTPANSKVTDRTKPALKGRRDRAIALAHGLDVPGEQPTNPADDAAKSQTDVESATKGRSAALAGLAGGLGVLAAAYLNADFLGAVGVTESERAVRLIVTGLVVAGGSKQLHDLITNVSKAKDKKETPPETSTGS